MLSINDLLNIDLKAGVFQLVISNDMYAAATRNSTLDLSNTATDERSENSNSRFTLRAVYPAINQNAVTKNDKATVSGKKVVE